jgi:hypothetical protein
VTPVVPVIPVVPVTPVVPEVLPLPIVPTVKEANSVSSLEVMDYEVKAELPLSNQAQFEDQEIPAGVPSCSKGAQCSASAIAHFISQSHPRCHSKLVGHSIVLARGEVIKGTYKGATVDVLADLSYKCKTWEELQAHPKDRPKGPYKNVGIRVVSSPASPQREGSNFFDLHI